MAEVAIAADSTHYLPRTLADSEDVHQVSLYVGWEGESQRELDMADFDAFYERLRCPRAHAADSGCCRRR